MAIAHVQTAQATEPSGTPAFVEVNIGTTTTGNFLVIAALWFSQTVGATPITDDGSHTWTQLGSEQVTTANQKIRLYYAYNITGRAAHKIRLTTDGGSCFPSIIASEFSGLLTTDPQDKTAGTIGTSTTPASGVTATRSQASELLIAIQTPEFSADTTIAAGTNVAWAIPTNGKITDGTQFSCGALEYFVASSAGTDQGQFTNGANKAWACIVGTFKAAADAAVPFVTQLGSQMVSLARTYPVGFYSFALGASLALSQAAPSAAPFAVHDWPVPPPPPWTLLVTISTQALDPNPPVVTLPFRQTDWPLPVGRAHPIALRTWTQSHPTFYVETQPIAQFDWPVPRRAPIPDRLSFIQQRTAGIPEIPLLPGPPFTQLDWPLPAAAKRVPTARLGFIGYYALNEAPELRAAISVDLPPTARPWPIGLGTWVQGRSILLDDTVPFHQVDWPLPPRRVAAQNGLLTWQQGRSLLLLEDLLPFHLTDWPVPRGRETAIALRTWTQGVLNSASLSVVPTSWGPLRAMRLNRLVLRIL